MSELAKPNAIKQYLEQDAVKAKFQELMGDKSKYFLTSVMQIVANNNMLAEAEPKSVYMAAMLAATLELPINNNLGYAYIIPYKSKGKTEAQFQISYKGYTQLAQRSGQFKALSATPIYEGQLISNNPLTGAMFDFSVEGDKVIGYAAYMKLLNGFEKTVYWTVDKVKKHAGKYSQSFKNGYGVWNDNFDEMACKTVTKYLLTKFAPLSVELQKAQIFDQSVINDVDTEDVSYIDNPPIDIDYEDLEMELISLFEQYGSALEPSLQKNIQRVIQNKEQNNYQSAIDKLKTVK
jgi:recombination protein RecT